MKKSKENKFEGLQEELHDRFGVTNPNQAQRVASLTEPGYHIEVVKPVNPAEPPKPRK